MPSGREMQEDQPCPSRGEETNSINTSWVQYRSITPGKSTHSETPTSGEIYLIRPFALPGTTPHMQNQSESCKPASCWAQRNESYLLSYINDQGHIQFSSEYSWTATVQELLTLCHLHGFHYFFNFPLFFACPLPCGILSLSTQYMTAKKNNTKCQRRSKVLWQLNGVNHIHCLVK